MTQALVSIRDLTVALPPGADRARAVENVTLDIHGNEIVCIVGESGSGKSLTAHAVMGLLPRGVAVTGGSILFQDTDLLQLPPDAMRRRRGRDLAMIFQDPMAALNPVMPIGRQIAEQIKAHRPVSEAEAMAEASALLSQMGLKDISGLLKAFPFQLSGGQRQRVMIAMALSLSPPLLIADEPTTALDVTTQAQILKLLKTIQTQREMSVLFITHDFGVVADIADRVAVMRHGRIVESGATADVLGHPADPYTKALIDAVPRLKSVPPPPSDAAPVLSVTGLSKTFHRGGMFSRDRSVAALDGVSLSLSRGETVGIVGESGSGKSTLARCIVRLLDPDAGEVLFDGVDIAHMPARALRARRRRMQMVFQDPFSSLNPRQTVGDIVTAGPRAYGEQKAASRTRAADILKLVGLEPAAMLRFPHEFSGGQRQRIGLARALMLKPDILIADEPVSALDVTVQAQVLKLLDDVRRQMNLAMLFITHDMRVAAQVCHRVVVMRAGRIVESGPTASVFAAPSSPYTRELLAAIPDASGWDLLPGHREDGMRIAVGELKQETNSFVPFTTTLKTFEEQYLHRGDAVLTAFAGARLEIPGALDALREAGATIVPLIATAAMASGVVERASFEILLGEMLDRLRAAGPVDGVYLALHGAMILEDEPDAEAEIVRRFRAVLPPGTPIAVSLDLHGHITAAMLQSDVTYIGYREFPHIDMYESGYRTARLLTDWIQGKIKPVMALAKRHMVVSPDSARTSVPPLSDIVAAGRAMEAAGDVLHVSLFPVQPWIDTPDLGFAALVCADGDKAAAQRAADILAKMAWDRRAEFEPTITPLDEIIRIGLSSEGLTVASDSGDAPSGGAAADSTAVLAALLHEGADRAARLSICTICDAEAAAAAARAGVGATVTLAVGHKRSGLGDPLTVTGTVKVISDGRYTLTGPGASGMTGEMGLTAVLAIGSIRLNLRSLPHFEWDPGIHTSVGLDPARAALVFVRSPAHFRASYAPIAARIFIADTPGPTCVNMRRIPFTKVTRPFYPLDLVND